MSTKNIAGHNVQTYAVFPIDFFRKVIHGRLS